VVVIVGPGADTVSVVADAGVTAGPGTGVGVVRPGSVTKIVVVWAGALLPGAPVRVVVSPGGVVVCVTIRVSPASVRSRVLHSPSWSALPTVPCAIVPIAATPTR